MKIHGKMFTLFVVLLTAMLATGTLGVGQEEKSSAKDDLKTKHTAYEPSHEHPFGRLNPDAPPETAQFEFMVGEFTCDDESRQPDGTWKKSKAFWTASYMMNGFAIQDHFYNDSVTAVSPRVFNQQKGKWIVSYYQMPQFFAGNIWEGEKKDVGMVLESEFSTPDGNKRISRLTFYNIREEGYDWKAESLPGGREEDAVTNWKLSCRRTQ
jgi:hypothetical protein